MAQYIDKAAVIAEMKRRIFNLEQLGDRKFIETHFNEQFRFIKVYEGIIDFINTLEVKEVDLEKAARQYLLHEHLSPLNNILHQANLKTELQYHTDIENAFKAGFELGLNIQKGE